MITRCDRCGSLTNSVIRGESGMINNPMVSVLVMKDPIAEPNPRLSVKLTNEQKEALKLNKKFDNAPKFQIKEVIRKIPEIIRK